jgi:predicted nuclease of predicted toxin-antitoxin system
LILWIDAQLSPQLAPWLTNTFSIPAQSVSSLGLRDASDLEIFQSARQASATIMSKDQDFVDLVTVHGAPPQIIWVTCGNTSNANLCTLLQRTFPIILTLLQSGEPLVELSRNL